MAGIVSVGLCLALAVLDPAPDRTPAQVSDTGSGAERSASGDSSDSTPSTRPPRTWIGEIGAGYGEYSSGFGHGSGSFARLTTMRQDRDWWRFEAGRASRFDERGTSLSVTYGVTLPGKLSLSAGVTSGTGGLAPDYRFDASISKPVLDRQNLILTLRLKEEQSNFANSTRGGSAGFVYYFPRYWIVEVNGRYDVGQPGSTSSHGIGGALTWGLYRKLYLTAGFDYGESSYAVIGPGQVVIDLTGRTYSFGLQHYVGAKWGYNTRLEYGSNSFYSGRGIQVGVFKEW